MTTETHPLQLMLPFFSTAHIAGIVDCYRSILNDKSVSADLKEFVRKRLLLAEDELIFRNEFAELFRSRCTSNP